MSIRRNEGVAFRSHTAGRRLQSDAVGGTVIPTVTSIRPVIAEANLSRCILLHRFAAQTNTA